MKKPLRAGLLVPLLLAAVSGSREAAAEGWSYEVIPFLWAAGIDGRQGFDGQVPDVDAAFEDLVEFVDTGISMRLRASKAPFGWYTELSYVKLGDEVATSTGELDITTAQTFAEGGFSYDFAPRLAAYGGLRYQKVDMDLRLGSAKVGRNEGWVDVVAGLQWTPVVTEHWVAWARADIGAGGSDFIWLGEIGGGYRFGTRWGAYAAYRLLDTDYASSNFVYDIRQSGLMLGFGIRF